MSYCKIDPHDGMFIEEMPGLSTAPNTVAGSPPFDRFQWPRWNGRYWVEGITRLTMPRLFRYTKLLIDSKLTTFGVQIDALSGGGSSEDLTAVLRDVVNYNGAYGITKGGLVTATDPASMNVQVAADTVFLAADGTLYRSGDEPIVLTIAAADPVLLRTDLVVCGSEGPYVVQGVPAAEPADPEIPAGTVALAMIACAAGQTTIPSDMIFMGNDYRHLLSAVLKNASGA